MPSLSLHEILNKGFEYFKLENSIIRIIHQV